MAFQKTFIQIHEWFLYNTTYMQYRHQCTHNSHLCLFMGGDGEIKAVILSSNTGTGHTHSKRGIRMLIISSSRSYWKGEAWRAGGSQTAAP